MQSVIRRTAWLYAGGLKQVSVAARAHGDHPGKCDFLKLLNHD